MRQTDLIVVGGGSAGCVLAWRLAVQQGRKVTVIEPPAQLAPQLDSLRPSRWLNLLGSAEDWSPHTEACSGLAGRRLAWPRGRGLGGSSRINAMIWFPPTPRDLQMLSAASDHRWSIEQLRAAYQTICAAVEPQSPSWLSQDSRRFLSAINELAGQHAMVYQRLNRAGRRWQPASLLEAAQRGGGRIEIVRATVDHLLWRNDRAAGVRVVVNDSTSDLFASDGVVLCGGTIATPAILMRSGIGPRDELAALQIDVRCDHPSVGRHLQDHLVMPVIFETRGNRAFSIDASPRDIARWQTLGSGPVASNIAECGGLFVDETIQVHLTPTNYLTFPKSSDIPAMTVAVNLTQPRSRGVIQLVSRDPLVPPRIKANYLSDPLDLTDLIAAVRWARRIASTTSLGSWIRSETLPGPRRQSDGELGKSIARYAQTLYHPIGSCRLGHQPEDVIDGRFAVRGTQALWIADAAVLPTLTIGNPNATVMMLAVLAADSIRAQMDGGACQ